MKFPTRQPARGSLILLVLCLVAVLGIALASYLAVSNQSMKLSRRAYATDVSRHLAEMGLERAIRSFSFNTFGSWTAAGNLASQTLNTSSSPHVPTTYGSSGIIPSVNIRVYNYRTGNQGVPWNAVTTYTVNDYVWYQGVWYLCISSPTIAVAPAPSNSAWVGAPAPWDSSATYRPGNIALSGSSAYRCITANSNQAPPNATYWTSYSVAAWSSATSYAVDDVVISGGVAYRCIAGSLNQSPPNTSYWLSCPVIYSEGVATMPDGTTAIKTQLRAYVVPASLFPNAAGAATYTNISAGGTVDSYDSPLGSYASQVAGVTNYSAVVAGTNTPPSIAVSITNATVKGYVAAPSATTTPFAPLWNYTVGSATLTGSAATGVDLTRVSRSPYVPQFDIQTITGSATVTLNSLTLSATGTVDLPRGTDTVSGDGKYYYYTTSYLYLYTSGTSGTININAPVVIDVRPTGSNGHLDIENNGKIVITNNSTASLEIHFGGELFIYSQNAAGGIQNLTLDPKRCILIGTNTTNTSGYHYLAANSVNLTFYGVIYMPNAYLHVWNSGKTQNIYGALSAQNIYFNHTAALHYDTSLRTATFSGVDAPYILSEVRELTDSTERITLP